MKIRSFITYIALTLNIAAYVYAEPSFTAKIDRDEVLIGDQVELKVHSVNDKGFEVSYPEGLNETGDFMFIKTETPGKSFFGISEMPEKIYVLGIYTTGIHVIPPVKVSYRKKGNGNPWESKDTNQVTLTVKSVLTGDEKDIRDIKGILSIRSKALRLISGIILGVAVFMVLAFLFYRYKNRKELIEAARLIRLPHEIAYDELRRLKQENLPDKGLIKEYYVRLSDIVRRYLEMRFDYKAPEMTTEEFLGHIKNRNELDDEAKSILKRFLSHCDMVKFAKYGPKPLEMLDSFKFAENIVDKTKIEDTPDKEDERGR